MRKTITSITAVMLCALMLLTGCSGKISKETVRQDIEPIVSEILSSDQTIDDIEILEYKSDEKKDTSVSIKVMSSNDVAEYTDYFMATYYYSADKEYVFDTHFVGVAASSDGTTTTLRYTNENQEVLTNIISPWFEDIVYGNKIEVENKN